MAEPAAGQQREDRIDLSYEWEVCVWARHFNTSEQRLKEAVQAVGNRAERVREHLAGIGALKPRPERPSAR